MSQTTLSDSVLFHTLQFAQLAGQSRVPGGMSDLSMRRFFSLNLRSVKIRSPEFSSW